MASGVHTRVHEVSAMSMQPRPSHAIPATTAQVAWAAFPGMVRSVGAEPKESLIEAGIVPAPVQMVYEIELPAELDRIESRTGLYSTLEGHYGVDTRTASLVRITREDADSYGCGPRPPDGISTITMGSPTSASRRPSASSSRASGRASRWRKRTT